MSDASQTIRLPADTLKELERLSAQVAIKQLELQNAQVHRELAMLRAVATLGLYGRKVTFDLDAGVLIADDTAQT